MEIFHQVTFILSLTFSDLLFCLNSNIFLLNENKDQVAVDKIAIWLSDKGTV